MKMKKHTLKQLQSTQSPQCKALLKEMEYNFVTSFDALLDCGIFRMASRINELNKVYELESKWVTTASNKKIKAWRLAK